MRRSVIKVENLSKQYQLGKVGTGTISHDLNRMWARLRGKEDPYLQVGEVNDRTKKGNSDFVWALRDINFEVAQGEVFGIIGKNGAGKSTLLKILSQITSPTTGRIAMRGRVGSLLEVGTGFHPELSGRENIFLNGAILGMRKWEIQKKLDEIISFSGVEKYLDTPVKRYSSGMKVRLGFAVAAHLEPEILIVDEVLAVGDIEFQEKCLGKMQDVSQQEGRTILFVSHNMQAVSTICNKCLLMENGTVNKIGATEEVISDYLGGIQHSSQRVWSRDDAPSQSGVTLRSLKINGDQFEINEEASFEVNFYCERESLLVISVHLITADNIHVLNIGSGDQLFAPGENKIRLKFPANFFNNIKYKIRLMVYLERKKIFDVEDAVVFEMTENKRDSQWFGKWKGVIRPQLEWRYNE